ncbi:MAG: hypothetical protein JJE55_14225 [Flavobacteriaceae bacterium]|nr:hypothetical protein [Flavobacteriaceae bacterium]
MNKIILLFLIIGNCCYSQESQINIKGNWYNYNEKKVLDIKYVETYFDEDYFISYDDDFGLKQGAYYRIKNEKIYLFIKDTIQDDGYLDIKFDNDILVLSTKEGKTVKLKKMGGAKKTLEMRVKNEIGETTFRNEFMKRKEIWEEFGYLPK